MPTVPLVSIVIATWNRKQDIEETIQSVYRQEYPCFELIIVDNASTDGTADLIRSSFPNVKLICLSENLGASGGRNRGMEQARGKYILCLDSDASLETNTLHAIVNAFEDDETIGVINSKILNAYTRDFDPVAGWAYSEKQKTKSDMSFFSHNFSETGCAFRRDAIQRSGMFWEKLFFGREGEELALRILDSGYKILYCHSAVVLHRVSPKMRVADTQRMYFDFRNALCIYVVRYPLWLLLLMLPMKMFAELIKAFRIKKGMWFLKSIWDVVLALPDLMKDRKPIHNSTARIYLNFQRDHGSLSWDLFTWFKFKSG